MDPRSSQRLDSVVIVEENDDDHRPSTSSSASVSHARPTTTKDTNDTNDDNDDNTIPPVTLGLSIRRGRLAVFTVAMVVIIAGLTVVFNRGVEIDHFEGTTKNATQRNKLLDDYNSYSGNIASIFGKPIEFFVMISSQVIVLRFMAETITRSGSSWRVGATTLALGAGIGYLISNGFNALNVQLRPLEIQPRITAADLSALATNGSSQATTTADSAVTTRVTSVASTVSERSPRNPITNTVLRTVVEPQVQTTETYCDWRVSYNRGEKEEVANSFTQLGFPQHDWQTQVLAEAIPPKQLRVVVNPTNASANAQVRSADLPMNASLAADLFAYSMLTLPYFFPIGELDDFVNRRELMELYKANQSMQNGAMATVLNLVPATHGVDTATQNDWFLRQSTAALIRQFTNSTNTSRSDIVMEFSHVDIGPRVTFDALTVEFEVDPRALLRTYTMANGTRYTTIFENDHLGATQALAMIDKANYTVLATLYDTPSQVLVSAMCADAQGNEALRATFAPSTGFFRQTDCLRNASSSSILVVSISKRLVADALTQNQTANASGMAFDNFPYSNDKTNDAVVTNLRKIYSFTVGRLAWQTTDLAETFHAACDSEATDKCTGLELPLGSATAGGGGGGVEAKSQTKQRLVVGAKALPIGQLALPNLDTTKPRFQTLVAVNEPSQIATRSAKYHALAGDVLLPHNIRDIRWYMRPPGKYSRESTATDFNNECNAQMEDRLQQILDNHYYMEHSLQPAYTAATFFLFQNGVVKDTIALSAGRQSLDFQGNSQQIALWISTPDQNAWLTLVVAVWFTKEDNDPLGKITEPDAIARVMLDDKQFPPMLLNRHVVDHKQASGRRPIAKFGIGSLSLQEEHEVDQDNHKTVV